MTDPSTIPSNDFHALWQEIHVEAHAALERTGQSGWLILGKEVATFERYLARYWGLAHAVGTGNGMDAAEIALRAAGLQPGDKVLTTPLSAFATSLAIVRAGGEPVFVDVDERGLIDLALAREVFSSRGDIRWFMPVHLFGHCLDMDELESLRFRFGVQLIEDCAQSIGAYHNGRACGTAGLAAITSFYPTKNLGALGDGGALLTNDNEVAESARMLRDYGQSAKYEHAEPGMNSRLDEVQAAILNDAMLPRLQRFTQRRREIAQCYLSGLENPDIDLTPARGGKGSVYHLFPVLVPTGRREAFVRHLQDHSVQSGIHYPKLIPHQHAMRHVAHEVPAPLPRAERFAACEVSLPLHPFLTDMQIERVISVCNSWRADA